MTIPTTEIITIFIFTIIIIIIFIHWLTKITIQMNNNDGKDALNKYNYIYDDTMFITNLLNKIKLINKNKKKKGKENEYHYDFYNISIFKSSFEANNYMLIIQPQNYHFFIENGELIYHPKKLDSLLKKYLCNNNNNNDKDNFELAYKLPLSDKTSPFPKIICHRNLNYLKLYIYKPENIIHYKYFHELQTPINAITAIINDITNDDDDDDI